MADRHGSLKMHIIDLRDILNESLKTLPDALPVEVVIDGKVLEIASVSMFNGSLCLHLREEDEKTLLNPQGCDSDCNEESLGNYFNV